MESRRIIKTVSMEKKGPFWEKLPDLTHSKHKSLEKI